MGNRIVILMALGILFLAGCIILPPVGVPSTELPPTEVPPTEVPPKEVPPTEVPLTRYTIKVRTSCIDYAGTDADVEISVYGSNGSIRDFFLDTDADNFEKCQTDNFTYGEIKDIGVPVRVEIGHDNSGGNAGWHLEYVSILNIRTGEEWRFECNCWLADDEGDGQLTRTLYR